MVPALRALRKACSRARIIVIVPSRAAEVSSMLPYIDDVIVAQHASEGCDGGSATARLSKEIRRIAELRFDGAIIFTRKGESPHAEAYLYYLAGIPFRVGMSSEFAGGVLSHWEKPLPTTHPVDRHLSLVASMGIPRAGRHLELKTPPEAAEEADYVVARLNLKRKDFVLFLARDDTGNGLPKVISKSMPVTVAAGNTLCVISAGECRDEAVYGGGPATNTALMRHAALAVTDRLLDTYLARAVRCPVRLLSWYCRRDAERGKGRSGDYETMRLGDCET